MTVDRRLEAVESDLPAFLGKLQRETGVPGIGAAVSMGGTRVEAYVGTLATGATTPVSPMARFQLGCLTKLLLAAATLELAAHGRLAIDAPLGEYLPALQRSSHGAEIAVRHLLSHTSGYHGIDILDRESRAFGWDQFVARLRASEQRFRPGSVFSYEHGEAVLLARILERVVGRSWFGAIDEAVLRPLGVEPPVGTEACAEAVRVIDHRYDSRAARFVPEHPPLPGELWQPAFSSSTLTLPDMLRLAEALAACAPGSVAGPLRGAHLLRSEAVTLPPMAGGPLRELLPTAFGLGAAILRGGYFGSTGVAGGQCVGLRFEPRRRLAIAVGLNAFVPHLRDLILTAISVSLTGESSNGAQPLPSVRLEELEGVYRGCGRRLVRAQYRHGRLLCAIGVEGSPHTVRAELAAGEDERWRLSSAAPQLSIGALREPGGAPVLMVGLQAFKRVDGRAVRAPE